jgi:protein-tyrosine phosphatase
MNILFICTGNVSRSAVAECILRTMAEREGRSDISVASAGTHNLYGQPYDPKMVAIAAKHGYTMAGHSQQMTKELLQNADYVFVMERDHRKQVQKLLPYTERYKVHQITQYCFGEEYNIEDPLYSDEHYEFAFRQIEACCTNILKRSARRAL